MKHEWRKHEKHIYLPKEQPSLLRVPLMKYITIEGVGNPNSEEYAKTIEALYGLSYGIKMAPKKGVEIKGYFEYTVYPLEGFWTLTEEGIHLYKGDGVKDIKDHLKYKMMIRQPDFVTIDLFNEIKRNVFEKKKNNRMLEASFEIIKEGKNLQMLHVGSYDSEPESFQIMEEYCQKKGYTRVSKDHKEIYLSDPRKVHESKLKTVLRFKVQ